MKRIYDLEDRLINFAVLCLKIVDHLPNSIGANALGKQLGRSGTSPALNYGEAQAAESQRDFSHKMKICLKELRESQICLKIIQRKAYVSERNIQPAVDECSELVAIFTSSVSTIQRKFHRNDKQNS